MTTTSTLRRALLATMLCGALAAPLAADAGTGPGGPGRGGGPARERRVPVVAYVVRGTVASVDDAAKTLTVTVRTANRHGRVVAGLDVAFDVSAARLRTSGVTDANGDGAVDLGDVAAGDRAKLAVRLPKRLTPETVQALVAGGVPAAAVKQVKVERAAGGADPQT